MSAEKRWMSLAVMSLTKDAKGQCGFPAMPDFEPTTFAEQSSMTDGEIERLVAIIREGVAIEHSDGATSQGSRLIATMLAAIDTFPHARFADLLEAAYVAQLQVADALREIEMLRDIVSAQPLYGVVSTTPLAEEVRAIVSVAEQEEF